MARNTHEVTDGLLRKLDALAPLDPAARAAVRAWPSVQRWVAKNHTIARERQEGAACRLLVSGLAARHRTTVQGKQQILAFLYPGDVIDLDFYHGRADDAELVALSEVTIVALPVTAMRATAAAHPAVAGALWADTLVAAAIGREWLLNVGQRDATARLAHLLCEAAARLAATGFGEATSVAFPFTQAQLAATLGLTAVHVNRTMRGLTERGLIGYTTSRVTIHDLPGLRRLGDFDPAYLRGRAPDATGQPR